MHSFHLFCSASNWYRNNMDSKPQSKARTCVYIRIYTECIWCWQIQWLIWACWSVKSHHSLRGTCRLPWSGSWLRIPDAAPNPVSQPLLSSMVESGRTAEQISLCFPTLAKAAPANTHQHSGAWRQLTFFSSLWAAVFLVFLSLFCFYFHVCEAVVWEEPVTIGEKSEIMVLVL